MDVLMPKLSDTMEEGTLLQWFIEEGATVAKGDVICEIETDKATMSFEAPAAGVISGMLPAGETVDVGVPIAIIDDGISTVESAAPTVEPEVAEPMDDAATGIPTADDGTPDWIGEVVPDAQVLPPPPPLPTPPPPPAPVAPRAPVAASPLARTRAMELGVDITRITGSGPGGRIVRADVEAAAVATPKSPPAAPVALPAGHAEPPEADLVPAHGDTAITPLSRFEMIAARRLTEAQLVPQYDVQRDIDARRLHDLRAELVAALPEVRPTVGDFVVLAVARAVADHPELLGQYVDGSRRAIGSVDVGVAVATDSGLLVPVIRGANALSVADLSTTVKDLARAARDGALRPDQMDGAAISVSNLGMYGVDRFRAILNPPEAAIIAVGGIREEAVVAGGAIVAGRRMSVNLTADHRVLDGARAAELLGAICALLEHPALLLLAPQS